MFDNCRESGCEISGVKEKKKVNGNRKGRGYVLALVYHLHLGGPWLRDMGWGVFFGGVGCGHLSGRGTMFLHIPEGKVRIEETAYGTKMRKHEKTAQRLLSSRTEPWPTHKQTGESILRQGSGLLKMIRGEKKGDSIKQ